MHDFEIQVLTIAGIAQGQGKEIAEQTQETNAVVTVNDGSNDDDDNNDNRSTKS